MDPNLGAALPKADAESGISRRLCTVRDVQLRDFTPVIGRVGQTKGLGWAFYLCAGGYLMPALMTTQLPETKGKRLE